MTDERLETVAFIMLMIVLSICGIAASLLAVAALVFVLR